MSRLLHCWALVCGVLIRLIFKGVVRRTVRHLGPAGVTTRGLDGTLLNLPCGVTTVVG